MFHTVCQYSQEW
uniref:Uncharacterized protein n=1 Tax=Moniliophthora roreri TaxID=221103 RepID=A0A0W0FU35_MONRR